MLELCLKIFPFRMLKIVTITDNQKLILPTLCDSCHLVQFFGNLFYRSTLIGYQKQIRFQFSANIFRDVYASNSLNQKIDSMILCSIHHCFSSTQTCSVKRTRIKTDLTVDNQKAVFYIVFFCQEFLESQHI